MYEDSHLDPARTLSILLANGTGMVSLGGTPYFTKIQGDLTNHH